MADIHDVVNADQETVAQLNTMSLNNDSSKDIYFATCAIVCAIQALGIRLDYVVRDTQLRRDVSFHHTD